MMDHERTRLAPFSIVELKMPIKDIKVPRKFGMRSLSVTSTRAHTIYTEAQTLDQALDIIQNSKSRKIVSRVGQRTENLVERELGPKPKVTLAKLKWMGEK